MRPGGLHAQEGREEEEGRWGGGHVEVGTRPGGRQAPGQGTPRSQTRKANVGRLQGTIDLKWHSVMIIGTGWNYYAGKGNKSEREIRRTIGVDKRKTGRCGQAIIGKDAFYAS